MFLASLAAAGAVTRPLLEESARREVLRDARLMMEAASAVRTYTIDHIAPHFAARADVFLPQSVPAFAATETINSLRREYPEYSYKEATLNPTNPRNRTADWEADVVNRFRQLPQQPEIVAERDALQGRALYIARPIQVNHPACMQCHGAPSAAPPAMLRIYGEANGFGWRQGEIVGAQIVSVPMDVPLRQARATFTTFMVSLSAVFAAFFVVLNLMLGWLILRPVRLLARSADRISTGDFSEKEFDERRADEIGILGGSFNRMRRSLEKAMQMIAMESRL
ncbi:DUF3365 domain-containing protein [Ramlibacter sp. AN1015]|uniref:c-type heme family protein n=1 Tax=Ramlibacter sp. AN1015 TaxID=3133428 RepID=UPI0030C22E94